MEHYHEEGPMRVNMTERVGEYNEFATFVKKHSKLKSCTTLIISFSVKIHCSCFSTANVNYGLREVLQHNEACKDRFKEQNERSNIG